MNHLLETPSVGSNIPAFLVAALEAACQRISPLWPLKDFVAVNPFLGLSHLHFLEAASLLRRTLHGEILPSREECRNILETGGIDEDDVRSAVEFARRTVPAPWSYYLRDHDKVSLQKELSEDSVGQDPERILTVADFQDELSGTTWAAFITEEISKWCSVYYDEGQSSWRMPWRDETLFKAWRGAARYDANPRMTGLATFPEVVERLPEEPLEVIATVVELLEIPPSLLTDFFHRQLLSIQGWSAYVQYQDRQKGTRALTDLLAVRLVYDWALWEQSRTSSSFLKGWQEKRVLMQKFKPDEGLLPRYLTQVAREKCYQRRLFNRVFMGERELPVKPMRARLHAVFCIDVRSEIMRRNLEFQDEGIVTSGFAGFFGMPIEHVSFGQERGLSQVPVLLSPKYKVRELPRCTHGAERETALRRLGERKRLGDSWNAFKTSAVSCFSFVETAGLWFGWKLGKELLARGGAPSFSPTTGSEVEIESSPETKSAGFGIPLTDQVNLAESALRNLGLTSDFARVILFCGHGSATTNNPYAAGLDCGACGGHSGRINARVAAAILNQDSVRQALQSRGIDIPSDTYFLGGHHVTTTDNFEIFGLSEVPSTHQADMSAMKGWLETASQAARMERSGRLGLSPRGADLEDQIRHRSRDWSQVRPEWGLANNAALIAAPRLRTKEINLSGRTFLHDYAAGHDPEGKVLELILTAPVVVANWINLQYYASTVNNRLFGSGNKTIHNVVGTLGIWQGNGGDLQTGLPMQSLHNGEIWMHEALRLSVIVETSREAVDRVLASQEEVRNLVRNGWLFLFVFEPEEGKLWQAMTSRVWQLVTQD